jgi:hypothetical protein
MYAHRKTEIEVKIAKNGIHNNSTNNSVSNQNLSFPRICAART